MFKKTFRLTAAAVLLSLTVGAGAALAGHQYTDVPGSNPWHPTVDFIADRGITGGCGGGNYCPTDGVTRGQMSAFLERQARVLTPDTIRLAQVGLGSASTYCETAEYTTPNYEQTAIMSIRYSKAGSANNAFWVVAQQSVNNGSWQSITGAHTVGGNSATEYGNTETNTAVAMAPNTPYEFRGLSASASGVTQGQCEIFVTIYHRMPGQAIDGTGGAAAASGVGVAE